MVKTTEKKVTIKCDAKHLLNALKTVRPTTIKCHRSYVTYYGKVLIKTTDDSKLLVIASDGSKTIMSVSIPAEYDCSVQFVLNIREAITFLNKEKVVTIEVSPTVVTMNTENAKMSLTYNTNYEEYIIPENKFVNRIKLPELFVSRLKHVIKFAASEEWRPVVVALYC